MLHYQNTITKKRKIKKNYLYELSDLSLDNVYNYLANKDIYNTIFINRSFSKRNHLSIRKICEKQYFSLTNVKYLKINNKHEYIKYIKLLRINDEMTEFKYWFGDENTIHQNSISIKIKEHVLPQSLTHLTFGDKFNHEIKEHVLPQSLTHLTFGLCFNKEIKKNVLPHNLTHLTFGRHFNKEIKENVLPPNLTHLSSDIVLIK